MIKVLRSLLLLILNDIDTGNSNISESELEEILLMCQRLNLKELSKIESANYLGISRATFDNYINRGWIPKGHKRQGFKELSWNKSDLEKFKTNYNK